MLWPVAVAIFLFTVSYPANDFAPPPSPPDIGLGMLLVYAGIAALTVGVVFAGVLPWALRQEGSVRRNGPGTRYPGHAVGTGLLDRVPSRTRGRRCAARLGWAGIYATKGRRLSQAALGIGVLGVLYNIASYAEVFI